MTQEEYEQKRSECWEEFLQKHEISTADGVTADAFLMAFDRAYALGKQETKQESKQERDADTPLWECLTDDEKREMQCRYHTNECVLYDHKKRTGDKAQSKAVARMKLLENLFGKHNLKCNE